ncbi:MAG TPA: hypothetical protein DEH78_13420 [Solibacterales bacterium]|nr:hypothetical protein [Bryobacterales bacterium]
MDETKQESSSSSDVSSVIRQVIQEFVKTEQSKAEPAYKAELLEERRRREQLERRVNELIEEATSSRRMAEEADRSAQIRSELQRLGVSKVELAYRAVRDDITRSDDGKLIARSRQGEVPVTEYLKDFVSENPELLPARITGGSGIAGGKRQAPAGGGIDLDKIRPDMSAEDRERVRQEIAHVASLTLRGA